MWRLKPSDTAASEKTMDSMRAQLAGYVSLTRRLCEEFDALRPGGRIAAIVYSTPERNGFFSTPINLIRERAKLPPPAPGQPGAFSLGADGVLEAELTAAGFTDVTVEAIDSPLRMEDAAEFTRYARESFGALHQMLSGLDEAEQERAWTDIEIAVAAFEGPGGFVGPCELLVGAGTRP